MHHVFFIHSSIHEHLGCFHLSAIVNNATVNLAVKISLQDPAFNSYSYIPISSGISGLYDHSVF